MKSRYTHKQGQYLSFIHHYTKLNRRPPAEADMQRYFLVTPPSVHQMVLTLEANGLIERTPWEARSIRLVIPPEDLPELESPHCKRPNPSVRYTVGRMETRKLPHTELEVSRACFGTMTFGGQTDESTAARIVDLCFDRGINFFDTANVYTDGQSETILGKLLKSRRSRSILASKVGSKTGESADAPRLSKKMILSHIDASLQRLQTDYVDLYYLHMPDYATPIDETLAAMDEVVRAGKARYPAISNYAAWQVAQIHCLSQKKSYRPPAVSQPMYNLLARGIEQEYVPFCKAFGVSMIVYNPLAGGLLTGKQQRERPLPGTRFDNNQLYLDRYWHPAYFDAVDQLQAVARDAGRPMIDLALNWLLSHTGTDCVILGASKVEQLEQSLDVFGRGPLPAEAIAGIDTVWRKLRGVPPKYNR